MSRRLGGVALVLAALATLSDDLRVVAVAAAVALLAAAVLDPPVLRSALRVAAVLTIALAAAAAGAAVALVQGPERGLLTAGGVVGRVLVLWIAAGVVGRGIDADGVVDGARRLGLERLGLVLGLALNALPRLAELASEVWMVHRLRSPGRWAAIRRSPRMAEVLLASAARSAMRRPRLRLAGPQRAVRTPRRRRSIHRHPWSSSPALRLRQDGCGRGRHWRLARAGLPVRGIVQPGMFAVTVARSASGARPRDRCRGQMRSGRAAAGRARDSYRFSSEGSSCGRGARRIAAGSVLVVDEIADRAAGDGHMPALRRALRPDASPPWCWWSAASSCRRCWRRCSRLT
jgi:hypothetical protein